MIRRKVIALLRRHWKIPAAIPLLFIVGWFGVPWLVPLPEGMEDFSQSPVIYDRHGEPLHRLTLTDFTRCEPVSLDDIPDELIEATLATEDKRFHSHGGIDLIATARALRDCLKEREV